MIKTIIVTGFIANAELEIKKVTAAADALAAELAEKVLRENENLIENVRDLDRKTVQFRLAVVHPSR